jgi:hypothetical protein
VAFAYLAVMFKSLTAGRLGPLHIAGLSSVGLIAVFWYEMNWVLLPVAGLTLLYSWFRCRGLSRRSIGLTATALVTLPGLTLIVARAYLVAGATETYSGTQLHLSTDSLVALGRGIFGALPASAWPLAAVSTRQAGDLSVDVRSVVCSLVLLLVVLAGLRIVPSRADAERRADSSSGGEAPWPTWVPAGAVLVYLFGAIGVFAVTEKYSQELYRLGTVYAFYAPALIAAGVLCFALIPWLRDWLSRTRFTGLLLVGLVLFVTVQETLAWSVLDTQREDMRAAAELVAAADAKSTVDERCLALDRFERAAFPFYAYPTDWMAANLDLLRRRSTGEPWCSSA